MTDINENEDNALQKPKEKKPRTAKQVEAFERAKQIRSETLKIKREQIEEIKKSKPVPKTVDAVKPDKPKPAPKPIKDESDDEEEQQVIIVKKKPKKKKPIVIYEDSESEEDEPPVRQPKLKRQVVETIVPIPPTYQFKIVS